MKCRRETIGKDSKEGRADIWQDKRKKVVRKDERKLVHRGAEEKR